MSTVNIQQNPQNLLQHCEVCGRTWEFTHTKTMCPSCIEKTKVISRTSRDSSTTVRATRQISSSEDSQFNKRFDELRNMLLKSRERRQ